MKGQWKNLRTNEAMWEMEEAVQEAYPFFFKVRQHLGRCYCKGEGNLIPLFLIPHCKYASKVITRPSKELKAKAPLEPLKDMCVGEIG